MRLKVKGRKLGLGTPVLKDKKAWGMFKDLSLVTSIPLQCVSDIKCSFKATWKDGKIYVNKEDHTCDNQENRKKTP